MVNRSGIELVLVGCALSVLGCSAPIEITPAPDQGVPVCALETESDCDPGPELMCVDLNHDAAHCGMCDRACPADVPCVGGACCTGVACGDACLGNSFRVERTSGPSECIAGYLHDLDGDGFDDAVYTCQLDESIQVYWGNPRGTLGTPFVLASGRVSPHLAFGDVDEDGRTDLVVAVQGEGPPFTDRLSIFFGGPSRTFPRQADVMLDGNPRTLVLSDLDRDGHLDVLIDRPGADEPCMYLLPGNGRGLFDTISPACVWTIPSPPDDSTGAVVLFTTDTQTRIARPTSQALWVLDLDAAGVLTNAAVVAVPGFPFVQGVTAWDLDGDHVLDAVVNGRPNSLGASVGVLRSTPDAETCDIDSEFAAAHEGNLVYLGGAGDFNGDGLMDMVGVAACCEQPTGTLDLYVREWDGDFQ
jgi:hypothetical protein